MPLIKSTFENAIGDCISLFACPKNGLFIARESETAWFIGRFPRARRRRAARNSFYIFESLRNVSHEGFQGARSWFLHIHTSLRRRRTRNESTYRRAIRSSHFLTPDRDVPNKI